MTKYFFLVFCLISGIEYAQDVNNILSQIPEYDKQELSKLFHVLMDEDQFVYTLFGDKPVSLSGDFRVTPYEVTLSGLSSGGVFWKKWDIWKKHENKFRIQNYLFIEEPAYNRKDVHMTFLFFINKAAFVNVVNNNIHIFQDILGCNFTALGLLQSIEKEHRFMSLIHCNEILLGILLGYDEHNAKLYARRMQLKKFITNKCFPTLPEKIPLPSKGFASIEEEEEFLSHQLQPFSDNESIPYAIQPVQFAADFNHKETQLLKIKYSKLRTKISLLYAQNRLFLNVIFSKLASR